MTTVPSGESIKLALVVVMFIGAANQDATREQRNRLRDEAIPPLRDPSLTPGQAWEKAVRTAAAIMGPAWSPSGEWDEWITALIGEGASS
ncbi:MAG: hypothetical protein H6515_14390 [Microthrixaceae bacterium]|nr:hypothetical protein [Microthrixaceae bacterium]